ncbi:zinc ribbon domain-containing protein [Streptomyces sp. NPDC021225]|uniref:zinc ribbon domain-containing protein n=1 Tax=Streptomyces sp. NPDC021225 TaxID=3365121 RepID=UPI00378FDEE6
MSRARYPSPHPHPGPTVGMDRGIAKPLALSDGTFRDHAPWLSKGETERLRRLEKSKERKRRARKPGEANSRRLTRTYDQIAQLRATAKRRAVDWQHKTTTSRRCSVCGFITPGSRESQARFVCKNPDCGYETNADTNAGRNIDHAAGQAVSGRGDFGVTRSKKRQPLTQPHAA